MYKKFVSNLAFLLLLNVLIKPFWVFGIDRGVQNAVGTQQYGVYFALFNYVFLFHILLDFGINNFNNRAIARQPDLLRGHLPSIIGLKGMLAGLYVMVCFAGAWWLGYDAFQIHLLVFMCINQILLSYILYFRSNLAGLHLFKRDGLVSILDRAIMILICAALLWGGFTAAPFRIEWFVYVQTAAYALVALTSFAMVARQNRAFVTVKKRNDGLMQQIFKSSYPFALLGLLMSLYNRMDAVMLEYLLPKTGADESGIYAMGYRLLDAANMVGLLFAALLLPMFSRMIAKGENVAQLTGFGGRLLFAISTVIATACYCYQNEIIALLYPMAADEYAAKVFAYLMPAYIAISSVYVYGTLLTANGSLRHLNIIAFSGVIINFALNYWLIPQSGALGAASATLFTQFLVAGAHIVVAIWLLKLPLKAWTILLPILFLLAVWCIHYGSIGLERVALGGKVVGIGSRRYACGFAFVFTRPG